MSGTFQKLDAEKVTECVALYRSGMSTGAIAKMFGVSRQSMWDVLRWRLELRPQLRYGDQNHFYRGGPTADDVAQNLLEKAIERGEVERKTQCEVCGDSGTMSDGRSKIHAHHCDYNFPLDVQWLCQKCHHEWHKHNRAIMKTESLTTEWHSHGGFMLVLSRREGERLMIGDNIVFTVLEIRGPNVRIGIEAPKEIPVYREEVFKVIHGQEGGGK